MFDIIDMKSLLLFDILTRSSYLLFDITDMKLLYTVWHY